MIRRHGCESHPVQEKHAGIARWGSVWAFVNRVRNMPRQLGKRLGGSKGVDEFMKLFCPGCLLL